MPSNACSGSWSRPALSSGPADMSWSPSRPAELLDIRGQILTVAATIGLVPRARCVALTAAFHGRRIHPGTTRSQRHAVAGIHALTGHPVALTGHHTVLVFGVNACLGLNGAPSGT
jgi:hypothetical protein